MSKTYRVDVAYGKIPSLAGLERMFRWVEYYDDMEAAPVDLVRTPLVAGVPLKGMVKVDLQLVTLDAYEHNPLHFMYRKAVEDLRRKALRPAVFEEFLAIVKSHPKVSGYTAMGSVRGPTDWPQYAPQYNVYPRGEKQLLMMLLGGRDWDEGDLFLVAPL